MSVSQKFSFRISKFVYHIEPIVRIVSAKCDRLSVVASLPLPRACKVSQHVETLNARGSSGLGETTHTEPSRNRQRRFCSGTPVVSRRFRSEAPATTVLRFRRSRRNAGGGVVRYEETVRERKDGVCVPLACMEMNEYIPPSLHEFTASEGAFHISLLLRLS